MDNRIVIKGNKDGLNAVINMDKFKDFDDMMEALIEKLSRGKQFYKGSTLKLTTDLKYITDKDVKKLKDILFQDFLIKDCVLEEKETKASRIFTGVYEGRTKFIRKTVRGGQRIEYEGNVVVIGDVNHGAEIQAAGNIIILGHLKGHVHAGAGGNSKAIVAAFSLQPEILQIAEMVTRSPEDDLRPKYPEVASIKDGAIMVEPYLPNKYI